MSISCGKELYVYAYHGIKKATDLSKPIDKKLYKGTNPSCHDFNQTTATCEFASLLVGFTTGQIQLVVPGRREQGKLFNEERLIDKTKVINHYILTVFGAKIINFVANFWIAKSKVIFN